MSLAVLRFLNIILAALLGGTSFGIWLGLNPKNYSVTTYIEQQHNLVGSLNSLMIALVISATIVTLVLAILQRNDMPIFFALLFAAGLFVSCMVITRYGNVPIQKEMLKWTPDFFPGNWTEFRDKWWMFHIMRTVVELAALMLVSWTIVKNKSAEDSSSQDHSN